MNVRLHLLMAFVAIFFACVSVSQANIAPPPLANKSALPISVAVFLNDITRIDPKIETIELEATLFLQWQDPRLAQADNSNNMATKQQRYTGRSAETKLANIWQPYLRFAHTRGSTQIKSLALNIEPNGVVSFTQRVTISVESEINMRRFPFDKQALSIIVRPFVDLGIPIKFVINHEHEGISEKAHNVEWVIQKFDSKTQENLAKPWRPQYQLHIHYARRAAFYIFKLFVPLFIIVLLSSSVFWLRREVLINRVRYTLSAFLTIVAFQWIVVQNTPRVSYLTLFDSVLLLSYFTLGLTMLVLTISSRVEEAKSKRIHHLARKLFPVWYLLGIIAIGIYFFST